MCSYVYFFLYVLFFSGFGAILSVNEVGAVYCLPYVPKYLTGMFISHSCDMSICLSSIYADNDGDIWRRYIHFLLMRVSFLGARW